MIQSAGRRQQGEVDTLTSGQFVDHVVTADHGQLTDHHSRPLTILACLQTFVNSMLYRKVKAE